VTLRGSTCIALGALALACSTLADTPDPEECRSDADCAVGQVCAVDQGRCLPGTEAAPRAHIGFDIRERAAGVLLFRVEVDGCDCIVEEEENIRELSVRRSWVSQQFFLDATVSETPPDGSMMDLPLVARFDLTQPSRYGPDLTPQFGVIDHPTYVGENEVDTILGWPRYHPRDEDIPPDLVMWEIKPEHQLPEEDETDPPPDLATRFVGLVPPRTDAARPCEVDTDCCVPQGDCDPTPNFCNTAVGECSAVVAPLWTFEHTYDPRCSRALEGDVISLDVSAPELERGEKLEGATVSLRYADVAGERLGTSVFVACEDDEDCGGSDQYCDPSTKECFVALAGRAADGSTATNPEGKFFTQVFTYCEARPDDVQLRRYEVTVQPPGPRPTVDYASDVRFNPPGASPNTPFPSTLCVPDWGAGATLELAFEGQPRTLAGAGGEYTCCDVGCLPATADDAAEGAPTAPERCDGRTSAGAVPVVAVESHLVIDVASPTWMDPWLEADCIPPSVDAQGRAGSLARTGTWSDPGAPCVVENVALGTTEEPRRYEVRFESEPGSVMASQDFVIELGPETPTLQTLSLSPRVLVTGVVNVDEAVCARRATSGDCAAREAVVMAERLRLPSEPEGSVPGPYFHSISTFYDPVAGRDGAFVLPLDPGGVYVVTALPLAGAEGGPAGFTLVDLRESSTLEPLKLVLGDGVVVTLRLEQFDQRSTVIPMDRGSYLVSDNALQVPGSDDLVDLNEIDACWTLAVDGPQGCKIRRLIPTGYDLVRSQVGEVRFTARRTKSPAQCSDHCQSGG